MKKFLLITLLVIMFTKVLSLYTDKVQMYTKFTMNTKRK